MDETYGKAEQLLNSIFESAGFDVHASASESDLGCLLAINGPDSGLLLNEGGKCVDLVERGRHAGNELLHLLPQFRAGPAAIGGKLRKPQPDALP